MKLQWHARAGEAMILAFMGIGLPLSPLVSAVLAGDAGYLRAYRSTLARCVRMWVALGRKHVIARHLELRTPAPERIDGHCTHCGNCCIDRACVYLRFDAASRSSCAIYGGRLFRALSCGRYPLSGRDIDLYACPTFRSIPIKSR
jgi:hypothetical protein